MERKSACKLITELTYKPGWEIKAVPNNRFEGAVTIKVTYPAARSERCFWPHYEELIPGGGKVDKTVLVRDCSDEDLYREVLDFLVDIEAHEAREFLRIKPTGWAPFHPHRFDGIKRHGTEDDDLKFGLV